MRTLTTTLEVFTKATTFELLEVSRRKQYLNGEPTDTFDSIYKVLINYEPIEIRVTDDGKIMDSSDKVIEQIQNGTPLKISFEQCLITISPKNQYELLIRGTAQKANLIHKQ